MDYIRPTPMENPILGLLAERLKQAQGFAAFDPMRRNESDILAGLLPASLLADPETRCKLDE